MTATATVTTNTASIRCEETNAHCFDLGNVSLQDASCPSPSICYVVGDVSTIVKTSDGGATWTLQNSVAPSTENLNFPTHPIALSSRKLSGLTCADSTTCISV